MGVDFMKVDLVHTPAQQMANSLPYSNQVAELIKVELPVIQLKRMPTCSWHV